MMFFPARPSLPRTTITSPMDITTLVRSRGGTRVLNELHSLVARARVLVGRFDPDVLSGPDARVAVEEFVALEK